MYNEETMQRFANPKNAGVVKNADAKGEVGNVGCGDVMKLYLKVEDGKITEAKFKTYGCVAAIVSSDVICDLIKGKTLDAALKVTDKDVMKMIGDIPPQKIHCSVMASEVIAAAIADYNKRSKKK